MCMEYSLITTTQNPYVLQNIQMLLSKHSDFQVKVREQMVYLVEMAGTAALKKLLIAAHGDAKRVNHFISQELCSFQNVPVDAVEILHSTLEDADRT